MRTLKHGQQTLWEAKKEGLKPKLKARLLKTEKPVDSVDLLETKEQRQALAKQGQQALVEKLGSEEAYRKWQSDKIKGRKKYINMETGDIRVLESLLKVMYYLQIERG